MQVIRSISRRRKVIVIHGMTGEYPSNNKTLWLGSIKRSLKEVEKFSFCFSFLTAFKGYRRQSRICTRSLSMVISTSNTLGLRKSSSLPSPRFWIHSHHSPWLGGNPVVPERSVCPATSPIDGGKEDGCRPFTSKTLQFVQNLNPSRFTISS